MPAIVPPPRSVGPTPPVGPVVQQPSPVYQTPPPTYAPPAPPPTFTAQVDPRLAAHADRITRRLDDPMGSTGRAIDMATSKIRDASEGRRGALRSMLSRQGSLGDSSASGFGERSINSDEGRQVAGAASGIALQRERDNDAFMLSATSALAAPGESAARDRRFGLDAWSQAESQRRADEQVRTNDWMRNIDLMFRLDV